jgi:hypothetical protein
MIRVYLDMEYSTAQAARHLKIGYATLHRWIASGKLKPPKLRKIGGVSVRMWGREDIQRARAFKALFYRKGRGRKKHPPLPEGYRLDG